MQGKTLGLRGAGLCSHSAAPVPGGAPECPFAGVEQAGPLRAAGVALANVPGLAPLAVHKLKVAGGRKGSFAPKSLENLAPAAAPPHDLVKNHPG